MSRRPCTERQRQSSNTMYVFSRVTLIYAYMLFTYRIMLSEWMHGFLQHIYFCLNCVVRVTFLDFLIWQLQFAIMVSKLPMIFMLPFSKMCHVVTVWSANPIIILLHHAWYKYNWSIRALQELIYWCVIFFHLLGVYTNRHDRLIQKLSMHGGLWQPIQPSTNCGSWRPWPHQSELHDRTVPINRGGFYTAAVDRMFKLYFLVLNIQYPPECRKVLHFYSS